MELKKCPYCESEVPKTAQKCAYCREWFKGHSSETKRKIYVLIALAAMFFILGDDKAPKGKKKFEKGVTPLSLVSHKLVRNGKRLFITGMIKNEDTSNWDHIYIRAKYKDKKGSLIDQSLDIVYAKAGETIPFLVEFQNFDKSDSSLYDNYYVEVTEASNY